MTQSYNYVYNPDVWTQETTTQEGVTPVRPVDNKRNILITSALPYVNNVPHLGNIIGSLLSADVYARYCRQRGYNTLYVCGTDEYGTATETKALDEKTTPAEICNKYHAIHREVYKWFDIKFDHFGRTSTKKQTEIAQKIFLDLHSRNMLKSEDVEQLYDPVVQKYLADRFVIGTCPNCKYEDARGDQCDLCGKLLNPLELISPKSKLSNAVPERRTTTHLFLDLPTLQPQLEDWIKKSTSEGDWTPVALTITQSWTKEGLKNRCITRDLKWGTPVPLEQYKDKVFYVWFDAPIGYLSITANYDPSGWELWWKNPENVELFQFMGKDNVPFHSVIFPSTLIGTGEPWTLVKTLSSTEYLNYEAGKFSKSRNVGVFGDQARDTGIPSEVWRYYLLTNRPEQSDTVFSWEDFQMKNNNELLANLGNYINRVLKFVENSYAGLVPTVAGGDLAAALNDGDKQYVEKINVLITEYIAALEKVKLKEGLHTCMSISRLGNQYLQEQKAWELLKNDKARCDVVINFAIQIVRALTALLEPYMPGLSHKVLAQLNVIIPEGEQNRIPEQLELNAVAGGHKIGKPEPLFAKYDEEQIKQWREKFAGDRAHREKFPLDIRVAKILEVEPHPDAEKLFKMQVQVGKDEKRQIVGGLRESYSKEELLNRTVLAICNLKHSKLRGEKSEGMLLVGKTDDGTKLGLLTPADAAVEPGTPVIPEGAQLDLASVIQPKVLTAELAKLTIGGSSVAQFMGKMPLQAKGVAIKCSNPDVPSGSKIY